MMTHGELLTHRWLPLFMDCTVLKIKCSSITFYKKEGTYGVISDMLGFILSASPLGLASLCFSSVRGELTSSHCDRSSGESHIESIMCNKLLRKSSYVLPIEYSLFVFSYLNLDTATR